MKTIHWQIRGLAAILAAVLSVMPAVADETPIIAGDDALIVKKISFQGAKRVSADTLYAFIQTKIGPEISPEQLSEDIKNLYKDAGFFADVAVDVNPIEGGGLEVIYRLIENPAIEGRVQIIGVEKLKDQKIREAISLKSGEVLSEKRRWESKRNILNVYKAAGYYLAEVEAITDLNPTENTASVTFKITEGQPIQVEEIHFIGNENISAKVLRKLMKTSVGKHFDETLFEQDVMTLLHYYQNQGYAQANVVKHFKRFSEGKTGLILDLTIDEGPQYTVSSYRMHIQSDTKPAFTEKAFRQMLSPAEGEIFNQAEFDQSLRRIQQAYQEKGYILSSLIPTPHYDENHGKVDITLEIDEGRAITITQVQLTGLNKTKEHVIRRELDRLGIKSGELFNVEAFPKARQRIFHLGPYIQNIEFIPSGSETSTRGLIVSVTETPRTGTFNVGGGYGMESGIFGLAEVGENNLFGRAYQIHLKGELGTENRHTGEVNFSTPWVFGTPTRLRASLYNTKRSQQVTTENGYEDYIYSRKGGAITVGRSITKNLDASIRFKNEYVNEERTEQEATDRLTRSITLSLSRNTRDYWGSLYHPISGSLNAISYEYSGGILGAENQFQKYSFDSSWFARIWNYSVLATRMQAGYLNSPHSDSDFLFIERYRLGGIDTIRGYNERGILPIDADTGLPNTDSTGRLMAASSPVASFTLQSVRGFKAFPSPYGC